MDGVPSGCRQAPAGSMKVVLRLPKLCRPTITSTRADVHVAAACIARLQELADPIAE